MNPKAPAFPNHEHEVHQVDRDEHGKITGGHFENIPQATGLSVRDYIAIEVIKGMLANTNYLYEKNKAAEVAYEFSDALIAESNKK